MAAVGKDGRSKVIVCIYVGLKLLSEHGLCINALMQKKYVRASEIVYLGQRITKSAIQNMPKRLKQLKMWHVLKLLNN
jgi:hypothetical protein